MFAPETKILERRACYGASDLIDSYRAVDLNRRMHFTMREAHDFLDNCLVNPIACSIEVYYVKNFWKCPEASGWEGWEHVGNHVGIGRQFYNFAKATLPVKELKFGDSPDFYGTFHGKTLENEPIRFYGDVGTVSFGAFFESWLSMKMGDYWISVLGNGDIHLLIQKCYTRYPLIGCKNSCKVMTNPLTASMIDGSAPRDLDSLWWEAGKLLDVPREIAA